jgi:hypothetical protein
MESANTFGEVNLGRHVVIFERLIVHRPSWYSIISFCVALRAEMSRIFVVAGSTSDQT